MFFSLLCTFLYVDVRQLRLFGLVEAYENVSGMQIGTNMFSTHYRSIMAELHYNAQELS